MSNQHNVERDFAISDCEKVKLLGDSLGSLATFECAL